MKANLEGRTFDVDLGPFVPRLSFLKDDRMRLQAQIGPNTIDETVDVNVRTVGRHLFLVTWAESSGNYIVQLQDHENGIVHNRARLADGNLFEVEGRILPV